MYICRHQGCSKASAEAAFVVVASSAPRDQRQQTRRCQTSGNILLIVFGNNPSAFWGHQLKHCEIESVSASEIGLYITVFSSSVDKCGASSYD